MKAARCYGTRGPWPTAASEGVGGGGNGDEWERAPFTLYHMAGPNTAAVDVPHFSSVAGWVFDHSFFGIFYFCEDPGPALTMKLTPWN